MTAALGSAISNPGQVVENLPSSVVAMVSAFGRSADAKLEPSYGMSFRFMVTINGILGDLGRWQQCSGLKMEFTPFAVKSGGVYTTLRYLPGEITYPKVVLKRAVESGSSDAVQKWLKQEATGWINGAQLENTASAQITLHDAMGREVLGWHLVGVRPSAWIGPDLDANSGKVAIEALELVHEGFQVVAGGAKPSEPSAKPAVLSLSEEADKSRIVTFMNTPAKMSVKRNTRKATVSQLAQSSGEGADAAGHESNTTILELPELYLAVPAASGQQLVDKIDLLTTWMVGAPPSASAKTPLVYPPLLLEWGDFKRQVTLSGLTSDYIRFASNGLPIRAKVTLTLTVQPPPRKPGTNPTSGGIAGRSAHTLILDENLPLLAHRRYGSPGRWRDLAEANGIDDPLRARPGSRLFIPAVAELPAGR